MQRLNKFVKGLAITEAASLGDYLILCFLQDSNFLTDETLHPMKLVSKKKNLALVGINDVAVKVVDGTDN